jgi:mannose-6-phosphate isomerase-like protein (cupin superfamily)
MDQRRAFMVQAGESRSQRKGVLGGEICLKVSKADTAGAWAMFEIPTAPRVGPPLHYHLTQDEWFYVLAGDHEFLIGSERYNVQAGSSVLGPRMVPHTWVNVGTSPGRLLALVEPAGQLEEFFVEFSKLISQAQPDSGAVTQLFARYDMEVVGPPLNAEDNLERVSTETESV